jgi:hypothetical protein
MIQLVQILKEGGFNMIKVIKYTMKIIDVQFCDTYTFEAYFLNSKEVNDFLMQNIEVGNVVTITNIEVVEMEKSEVLR